MSRVFFCSESASLHWLAKPSRRKKKKSTRVCPTQKMTTTRQSLHAFSIRLVRSVGRRESNPSPSPVAFMRKLTSYASSSFSHLVAPFALHSAYCCLPVLSSSRLLPSTTSCRARALATCDDFSLPMRIRNPSFCASIYTPTLVPRTTIAQRIRPVLQQLCFC